MLYLRSVVIFDNWREVAVAVLLNAPINVLPQWGECGHIGAIDNKTLPVSGEILFFLTRASPGVGIIDILDRGGLGLLLTSRRALPKEKGKQTLNEG